MANEVDRRGCPTCGADLVCCPECKTRYVDGSGYCATCDTFTGPSDLGLRRAAATPPSPLTEEQAKEKSATVNGLLWNQLAESIEYIRNDEVHDAALRIIEELRRTSELMAVATEKES